MEENRAIGQILLNMAPKQHNVWTHDPEQRKIRYVCNKRL